MSRLVQTFENDKSSKLCHLTVYSKTEASSCFHWSQERNKATEVQNGGFIGIV